MISRGSAGKNLAAFIVNLNTPLVDPGGKNAGKSSFKTEYQISPI
jgi:hypothetical protein